MLVLPGGAKMELVYVAPGSFMMGCYGPSDEAGDGFDESAHRVTLTKGYWLGKYEVTQAQWQSVMGDNPSHLIGAGRPVEQVSWEDCQKFIQVVCKAMALDTINDMRTATGIGEGMSLSNRYRIVRQLDKGRYDSHSQFRH